MSLIRTRFQSWRTGGIPARILGLTLVLGTVLLPAASRGDPMEQPYPGKAAAIGSPANGCLIGAEPMPLTGLGWDVMRPARNRNWGHPALIRFLGDMAEKVHAHKLGNMLIGDLAQPRGGRFANGHGSHQTGLDVDIFFRAGDHSLSPEERAMPDLSPYVNGDNQMIPELWGATQTEMLRLFAEDPRVERIFIGAAIKKNLCQSVQGDRSWLHKLRPWWGHKEHFHVRIGCPADSASCLPGPAIPAGDGCGSELDWWFTDEAKTKVKAVEHSQPIPEQCRGIVRVDER